MRLHHRLVYVGLSLHLLASGAPAGALPLNVDLTASVDGDEARGNGAENHLAEAADIEIAEDINSEVGKPLPSTTVSATSTAPYKPAAPAQPLESAHPSPQAFDFSEITIRDLLEEHLAQVAQEEAPSLEGKTEGGAAEENLSPECAAFAEQPDADIGDVLAAGCQPTLAQMSALMDNPVGNVAMLFTQFDFAQMENPSNKGTTAFKNTYTGIAQFPKGLNKDWNLINRIVWTVPSVPISQSKLDDFSPSKVRNRFEGRARDLFAPRLSANANNIPGNINDFGTGPDTSFLPPSGSPPSPIDLFSGRTTGFGDMYYVGLFSPKKAPKIGNGSLLWGAGFDLGFPTASAEILGTGKWMAGPSALLAYLGPKWKVGFLAQQYWDFAGDSSRDPVNLTNIQYFLYYSLDEVTSIGVGPNIIANWRQDPGNQWTVPVGIGINRTFQFGKIPVRIGVEAHYSAIRPDSVVGSNWNYRLYIVPAVPAALFSWMR